MMNEKGTVYWITGLSGAGKTTIGTLLYEHIKSKKKNVVLLDGDELRMIYKSTDYSMEGREKLAYQHARLCKMLADQNIDVICCVIAMFDGCRKWNRENIEQYREVYLKVPINELIKRDQKKLYSRALHNEINNVMGIDIGFEEPKNADITVDNSGINKPTEVINNIIINLDI